MTPLAEYLTSKKITQATFAKQVGRTQEWVSRVASGKRRLTMEAAAQIERATNGAVPVSAWIERIS